MALNILLADDSMTAQNMGKKILVDAGYHVVAVSNGAAAIKKIASDRPDIIILDVYMPGYTGLEVCERVKGAVETSRIPVLLTVGKMEPFKPEDANRVRADGVMIKPFEATDLVAAIQNIAGKMAPSAGAAQPQPAPMGTAATGDDAPSVASSSQLDYEDTILLTPDQIRAAQESNCSKSPGPAASWAEKEPAALQAAESIPAFGVLEPEPQSAPVAAPIAPYDSEQPAFVMDLQPALPVVPGLDASEAPIARAMAGAMTGHDFFAVAPAETKTPAQPAEPSPAAPAMFAVQQTPSASDAEPAFALSQNEFAEADPLLVAAESVLETTEPEFETSPLASPESNFTTPAVEFEPNPAPTEEIVSENMPELEINSPVHLQEQVNVEADPGLVTEEEDMSQFVTRFGHESGEEVRVGIVSELPAEQYSALTSELETADLQLEQDVVAEQAEESVSPAVELPEPESTAGPEIAVELSPEPVAEAYGSVLDEVGSIAPQAALHGTGPMVAYVPGIVDTQPMTAYVEAEPVPAVVSADLAVTEPEPPVSAPEPVSVVEPAPVVTPSVFEQASAEEPVSATEFAVASAASAVASFGLSNAVTHQQPSPIEQPRAESSPAGKGSEPESLVATEAAEIAETAAAEDIPAPVAVAEPETYVPAEIEPVIATAVEPAVAAVAERVAESPGIADNRLSEAVARALEKLRPQLISEILKELTK